jgi:predicted dehydrogenase
MSENVKTINVAFIGAGGYAFEIIKRMWDLPRIYNIAAVYSLPDYKAFGLTECIKRNIPIYYDLSTMLDELRGKVETVFIPTSIYSHYELAKQCVEQGYNVYVEKPPVAVIQDYDDLQRCLRKHGKKGAIGFQYLYTDILQRIKSYICSEKYGKVRRVRSYGAWIRYESYYDNTEWGGKVKFDGKWVLDGSINNALAHMVAGSLYLACDKQMSMAVPETVQAELYSVHHIDGEDTSSIRVITDKGVEIVMITTHCSEKDTCVETVIECDNAVITYTDFDRCVIRSAGGIVEEFEDKDEHRTFMLRSIADALNTDSDFCADIKNCRAFTLTVNSAYESSGGVERIDDMYVREEPYADTTKRVLIGIDNDILSAHNRGMLFSECGFDWAVKTNPFRCAGYDFFPGSKKLEADLTRALVKV